MRMCILETTAMGGRNPTRKIVTQDYALAAADVYADINARLPPERRSNLRFVRTFDLTIEEGDKPKITIVH